MPDNSSSKNHRLALVGSALRVANLIVTTLIGFLLMPFVVHHLGDRSYGFWALVASVLGYYGVLDLGIVTAVQFKVAKTIGENDSASENRILSTAFCAFSVLGMGILILTATLAFFARFITHSANDLFLFRALLLMMGAGFAVGFPGRAFMGALSAHLRFDLGASISILILAFRTVLILVIIGRGAGILSLAAISLLSDALNYVCTYLALRRVQPRIRVSVRLASWDTFKDLFNYSGYALVIQISDQLRFFVDGWMVGAFVGVSAVTHYAIASRLAQGFLALIIACVGLLAPWFSQMLGAADLAGMRRVFVIGTKISTAISTAVACSLLLYGQVFISAWMGRSYSDAYVPLALLVIAIYCDVAQLPSVSYMLGVERHQFLAILTLAEGIANVALSIYWGRSLGMVGVALGTLVPMMIAKVVVQPFYLCHLLELRGAAYLRIIARSALPTALAALTLWVLFRRADLSSLAAISALICCQGMVSLSLGFWLAFSDPERKSILAHLLRRRSPSLKGQPVSVLS